jgi:hypothetical protein
MACHSGDRMDAIIVKTFFIDRINAKNTVVTLLDLRSKCVNHLEVLPFEKAPHT